MASINPLFAKIVVTPKTAEETTASGIVLPDTGNKETPTEGEVLAVGPDAKHVKIGDRVLLKRYSITEVKVDDNDLFVLDEEDILATLS